MPKIKISEIITKEIDIPLSTLYILVENLSKQEKFDLLKHLANQGSLQEFKKDDINSILADFSESELYEEGFLDDLKKGLELSSMGSN